MEPIPGVDLSKSVKQADEALVKVASTRLTEYVKSLRIQRHNLLVKETRLRTEADQAAAQRSVIDARITRIGAGDWSAVEPFELGGAKMEAAKPEDVK